MGKKGTGKKVNAKKSPPKPPAGRGSTEVQAGSLPVDDQVIFYFLIGRRVVGSAGNEPALGAEKKKKRWVKVARGWVLPSWFTKIVKRVRNLSERLMTKH